MGKAGNKATTSRPDEGSKGSKHAGEPVTTDEVAALLRQARAPEPWAQPDCLSDIADTMNSAAGLRAAMTIIRLPRKLRLQAQAAVDKLREVLPSIIACSLADIDHPPLLAVAGKTLEEQAAWKVQMQAEVQAQLRLYAALKDFASDVKSMKEWGLAPGKGKTWPATAALLFLQYRKVVGKASTSENNSAVQFIEIALKRSGCTGHTVTPGAIEQALRRHPLTTKRT